MRKTLWLFGCAALAGAAALIPPRADASDAPAHPGRAPPQEAIEACASLQEGTTCTVTFSDGRQMSGTCRTGPNGEAAACLPDHPPGPGGHRPPPEAVQACASLQEGSACSFETPRGDELGGTCRAAPDGSGLACAPDGQPPRG